MISVTEHLYIVNMIIIKLNSITPICICWLTMSTKFTVEKIVQSFAIIFFLTSCSFEYSSNSNTQATPSLVGVQNQVNTNSKNSNNLPSKTLALKTHPVVNYKSVFDNAIMTANMASTLDAKHENDRKLIIDLYKESINSLKKIPSEDQFYKIAQTKIEEYQRKKDNALNSRLTRNHNHIDNQKDKVVKNSIVQSKPKVVVSKATPEDHQLNMQQKLTNFLEDTLDKIVNKNYSFGVYWLID